MGLFTSAGIDYSPHTVHVIGLFFNTVSCEGKELFVNKIKLQKQNLNYILKPLRSVPIQQSS